MKRFLCWLFGHVEGIGVADGPEKCEHGGWSWEYRTFCDRCDEEMKSERACGGTKGHEQKSEAP